jgi:Co/Zn/Cd efflux system component
MGLIGALALAVNVAGVLILIKYKDDDANVRSVWLCSRNDAMGNVASGRGCRWITATGWPDVIVAAILASLFLNSARKILRRIIISRSQRLQDAAVSDRPARAGGDHSEQR